MAANQIRQAAPFISSDMKTMATEEMLRIIGSNPSLRSDRKGRMTLAGAIYWLAKQREWIDHCGGDLQGYIANYGSVDDPEHSGDGAEPIYAADMAQLATYEDLVRELSRHESMADMSLVQFDVAIWLRSRAGSGGAIASVIDREGHPHFNIEIQGGRYRVTIEPIID